MSKRGKTMIYNKSTHPVEVKKISIRLWSLRDEIEAAIDRRMKECEAAGIPLYIEDIKEFYNLHPEAEQSNVLQLSDAAKEDGMTTLMESLGEEAKEESADPAPAPAPEGQAPQMAQAETIIAEQA